MLTSTATLRSSTHHRRNLLWLLPVLALVCVAMARTVYVSLYGAALPYWDQWDQLDFQLRPWFDSTWHFAQLFAPHMAHRIAFTRIISFVLATINGHVFDNLVEAYVNAFIYALLWGVLCAALMYRDASKARRWLIVIASIALGVLPFDWENTLIGYQNQFYLLELGAVVMIAIAAYRACTASTLILLVVLAITNLFTMASGLLAAPTAAFAILLCAWRNQEKSIHLPIALVAMALITIFGLVLLKHAPSDTALHAKDASEYFKSLVVAMMWPLQSPLFGSMWWVFTALVWAPCVVWLCLFFRTRRAEPNEIFATSIAGWVFLQCLAIAYARGHDMQYLPSRYCEIPAIGLAANLWLALKLAGKGSAMRWVAPVVCVAIILIGWVFWYRTPGDLASMRQRHIFTTVETYNVQRYLAGVPLPVLPPNSQEIPYPTAARLRALLDNTAIRALLPPSAFPPTDLPNRQTPLSHIAEVIQRSIRAWFPERVWDVDARELEVLAPSTFSVYTHPIASELHNPQCSLDAINGQPSANAKPVSPGSVVIFGGWMGNGHGKSVADGIIILKGATRSYAAPFATGVRRPDVATAWHSEDMARSGYNLTATLNGVVAGSYSIFASDPMDPSAMCNLHRTLVVQ